MKNKLQLTKKDWISVIIIALIYFIIGINGLGTRNAPQTFYTAGSKEGLNKEIVLSFEKIEDIASVEIYLGVKEKRYITAFAAINGEWEKVSEPFQLKSVFAWNYVKVDKSTSQLDLIFSDEEAQIGEIVVLDKSGNTIMPINAEDYPKLFDEQKCFVNPPTYYNQTMFDEVYHGRTAYEFLHGLPIYETTHPPLGKTLISIGIAIWGMNPFGMRIVCLLFGTLMLPIIYLFALRITKEGKYALFTEIVLATEFMHFTLSRIATIDIIVAFFILCMFYGVLAFIQEEKKRYLLWAGMASAFGIATKWTAFYALLGLAIILFCWMIIRFMQTGIKRENIKTWLTFIGVCLGCFIVIPAFVYVLSYIPFVKAYPDKNILENAIANSKSILWYHTSELTKTPHISSSPWYLWLIDWVPLPDSYTYTSIGKSVVMTFVNPFVCYLGLAALAYQIYRFLLKKDQIAGFLLVYYFVMLCPWMFITRTVFIYQYFVCTQALILMIAYSVYSMKTKNDTKVLRILGAISVAFFIVFFPVISGTEASINYIDGFLKWFPRWKF